MIGKYAYTPDIWPSIISALFLLALAMYGLKRRSVPGALPFAIGCLTAIPIGFSMLMTISAVSAETKIFWYQVESSAVLFCVTSMTCFILEYAWPGRWLTRRNLILFSVAPILSVLFNLMNQSNHLGFSGFEVDKLVIPHYGPVGWFFVGYTMLLTIINLAVFVWLFRLSPQHRWPVAIMMTAQIVVRVLYVSTSAIKDTWLLMIPEYTFVYIAYGIALFGYGIFDPFNLVWKSVMNQMHEGVLILDLNQTIANLNPAAEQMLQIPARLAKRKHIRQLLPDYPAENFNVSDEINLEFSLKRKAISAAPDVPTKRKQNSHSLDIPAEILPPNSLQDIKEGTRNLGEVELEARYFLLHASPLNDWRGSKVGRLLLLSDVTERRLAQMLLIEHQRALAMLQERELLARELHDSIGQVLGYAGFQVDAAIKLIQDGKLDIAKSHLGSLASIVRDAHADVRERISDLRAEQGSSEPFSQLLRNFLNGFASNYGIAIVLNIDERLQDDHLPVDGKLHLFRIIQEAVMNSRQHGQARNILLNLTMVDSIVRLTIEDDGVGFEPRKLAEDKEPHYGLQFMRERAEMLGGNLVVDSVPGSGTRVTIEVPVRRRNDAYSSGR